MKLQSTAPKQARQQTYMGISHRKKAVKTPVKKIKVPSLQQITIKALNAMLHTPASQKVNTPSLNSAAQRGNESFNVFSARSSSPMSEQPFSRSVSRDYKWQDSNFSKHYAQQQKSLTLKRIPSKKNTESSESWLMDHRTIKGDLAPGTQIYCQQSPQKQQIPPIKSSRQHIKHDSLNGRFAYAFAPDTGRPQDYTPQKYTKITKNFYENAKRTSAALRDRNALSQSDIFTQKSADQDLKNYMNGIQHRNLPKGSATGFLYDGESDEPHFRKSGKGGTKGNYMKIQRTQISNLPGALPSNSSPLRNAESYKKPVGVLLATTPEIKMRSGLRQQSPEPGLITPLPTTSITPKPTISKNRYTALMGTSATPSRRQIAFPAISPPKSRQVEKKAQNMIIPKSIVEKEFTAQDGVLEKTIGGYTQTTRDTPSPVSQRDINGSPNIRGLHPLKQTVMA